MYGMGIKKLAADLECTEEQAKSLKKKYNANVSFLKNIVTKATRYASNQGFITTLMGRKCRFNLWTSRDFNNRKVFSEENALKEWPLNEIERAHTYKALNRLIQGSAADQTKQAMVNLRKQVGVIPMIQIHDELNISIANETQVKEIKEIMETAVELHVPVKCEVKIGKNWGESE
jgi:DNA polymerase I-like protein with 3'-5' exonuclease and polymerase domains